MLEPKKLALIRILQILQEKSDSDNSLTQEDIATYLNKDYGIEIERKAIARNLSLLKEAGYDIENTRKGSYLASRDFEDSELRLLIDGVLSSRYINAKHSKDLIEKLCKLSNERFKSNVKNIYTVNDWSKSDNMSLFYNIEVVDEAIEKSKQITFDYNKYGIDKKLHLSASHTVSPYQLILHNQRYFLMAYNEKRGNIVYYRMDRITNICLSGTPLTPLKSIKGYEAGIDYRRFSASLPYMFADEVQKISFKAPEWMSDQIVDWFGFDFKVERANDVECIFNIKASPKAMEYWAMQYLNFVEVLQPFDLREKIKNNIQSALNKYN